MAVSLTHATVAAGVDVGDGEIKKAQWNEAHTLTMATARLMGRTTAGTGAIEEISAGASLTLSALTLDTVQNIQTTSTPTFAAVTLSGTAPALTLTDTDTGYDCIVDGGGTTGSIRLRADANNESLTDSFISFAVDGTERAQLSNTGQLQLDGGLYLGGDVAGTNLLEVYDEGTWTPGVTFGGASTGITYTTQSGEYTRIGDTVHINSILQLSSLGTASGVMRLTGLPYAASNPGTGFRYVMRTRFAGTHSLPTAGRAVRPTILASQSVAIHQYQSGTGVANLTETNFGTGTIWQIAGWYMTDSA